MENHRKHTLGHRAFFLFLSGRSKFLVFLIVLAAGLWWTESMIPGGGEVAFWVGYGAEIVALLAAAWLLLILFYTYMEYRSYTYLFMPEAFVVNQGYILKNEIATLYHQIQNVNIERRPLDRMVGVSTLVIILAAARHEEDHNRIILPGLGRTKAKLVQKEILQRARRHAGGGAVSSGSRTE